MPATLASARLHAICGESQVLRDERLAGILAGWPGVINRSIEPADLPRIILDLDTPSLFDQPTAWVIRCDGRYLRKHAELICTAVGVPAGSVLILVFAEIEKAAKPSKPAKSGQPTKAAKKSGRSADPAGGDAGTEDQVARLFKQLTEAGAWHAVPVPDSKALAAWLTGRLGDLPQGIERAGMVADALIEHVGEDVDALLAAIATLAVYAGDQAITPQAVDRLITGTAERPIWEFTGAVLDGQAGKALELLHAGGGMPAQAALTALVGEIRKLIACCATADDGLAAAWAGARGRPNLYYARQRARTIGRPNLQRLLHGCYLAQRQLRQGGTDQDLAIESLVLHARRIVRPVGR